MIIIEAKSIEEIKHEIENLTEYRILFDELEHSTLFNPEISMRINNHDFFQSRMLVSEILEKREINDRIGNLGFHVKSLKDAVSDNDHEKTRVKISLILNNEYSSIKTIISELNSFKNKIDEFEKLHNDLLKSSLLSLDIKMLLEQDFRKRQKLNELLDRQKSITLNLSNLFVRLAKDSMHKKG